jgi:predicted  nucleic acid-binding Zn-ribbon protein
MSDFTSPSAIKAGVDALEQGYERFLAITKERLEAVYPAAATGFDQLDDMRRRTIDGVLSVGKTAAHGWDDLADMVAAHQEAMMEGVRAMNQSWFGGGALEALDAVEATLGDMRARMTADIEAMRTHAAELREQQGQALKTVSDGLTADIEAAKQAVQGAASEAAAAKSEAVEAKSEATEAKSEAVAASEAVSALSAAVEEKIGAQVEVLRAVLDGGIAETIEAQIDSARKEIERETDEEVDEKLAALRTTLDERLGKIEAALAADIAKMRDEIAGLTKAAKTAPTKKPAAAKRATAKATKSTKKAGG